jgi:hypothetical protein
LLVRSAKGKLSIRRIDRVAVVGQQVWFSFFSCFLAGYLELDSILESL